MKNLELEQMENVNGGWNSCEWGMAGVGAFWGVAVAVASGPAAPLVGADFCLGWSYLTSEIC